MALKVLKNAVFHVIFRRRILFKVRSITGSGSHQKETILKFVVEYQSSTTTMPLSHKDENMYASGHKENSVN